MIKYGYVFGCVLIKSRVRLHAPERVPIIYFRDKTRLQMFYFDFNTTVSLKCAALAFLESVYVDNLCLLFTVPWDPNICIFQDAY